LTDAHNKHPVKTPVTWAAVHEALHSGAHQCQALVRLKPQAPSQQSERQAVIDSGQALLYSSEAKQLQQSERQEFATSRTWAPYDLLRHIERQTANNSLLKSASHQTAAPQ
jgi:hypothetical protein